MRDPIKLHWAKSKPNFGDWLSPKIVECVSGRPVRYAAMDECDLVAIGSLLQRVKNRFWTRKIHVWGTGFIEDGGAARNRHYIHAVRGPGTLARLGEKIVPFGDPGLLADRLLDGSSIAKKHRVSVIPHYKDKSSKGLQAFCEMNPDANVIDVFADAETVLTDIAASHCVVSSAMHGLIASDALAVPNCRVVFTGGLRGGDFKFNDYYNGTGFVSLDCEPAGFDASRHEEVMAGCARPGLSELKVALEKAFPQF